MKRALFSFMSIVLLSPLVVAAWVMQSSPFVFPSVSTIGGERTVASQLGITANYDAIRGVVHFRYSLPSTAAGAKLNVYNVAGTKVSTFDLAPGSTAVNWSFANSKIATGIYLVSLRIGAVEQTTQISIVK
jgi:hypothetical protein